MRQRSGAVLEAPALVPGLDDVAVMGEAIEERRGHLGIAEHARPFAEGEIGGDKDRGALVEPADEVEEKLAAGLGERQVAELVEDDEVHAGERIGDAALAPGARLGLELVDEIDGGEEAPAPSGADAASRNGDHCVRLAGAGRDSDMAPGFWRAKRQSTSTMPFIHSLAGRWPRAVGASFSGAMCISRFVLP